jgi:hypothetical protein
MKVLITHSVGDEEQFWITRFASQLREQNITPISGYSLDMVSPNLVIGLATMSGSNEKQFLEDYEIAHKKKVPFLMLIERNSYVTSKINLNDEVIFFEKGNIEEAIEIAKSRFDMAAKNISNKPLSFLKKYSIWLIAGPILIIAAMVLSNIFKTERTLNA